MCERPSDDGLVCLDGAFVAPSEARISPFDHGFLYGDGVYETMRAYGGRLFRLEAHLSRLEDGLAKLAIEAVPSRKTLRAWVEETLARSGLREASVRLTVTRGIGAGGLDPAGCLRPTVFVAARPLAAHDPKRWEEGIGATILWTRSATDQPPLDVKTTACQRSVLALREARRRGYDDGLFLGARGDVVEATTANVFAVVGGRLLTPPRGECLSGITRAEVLALADALGVLSDEASIGLLEEATEVFLTSSIAELVPVVSVDGLPIGTGRPGPVYRRLRAAFDERTGAPGG